MHRSVCTQCMAAQPIEEQAQMAFELGALRPTFGLGAPKQSRGHLSSVHFSPTFALQANTMGSVSFSISFDAKA